MRIDFAKTLHDHGLRVFESVFGKECLLKEIGDAFFSSR